MNSFAKRVAKMFELQAEPMKPDMAPLTLGEGPCWDARRQLLYCVDIKGRTVHRFDTVNGTHEFCGTPSMVGFVLLEEQSDDHLIIGLQDGVYRLEFATGKLSPLSKPPMGTDNRFNDAKTDPRGRLWAGTMNLEPEENATGALYAFDNGTVREFITGLGISNGLGWTADGKSMFHTDTKRDPAIFVYDFDAASGTATNGRPFKNGKEGRGSHDGLSVDMDGRVYTAKWGGGAVEIYTANGNLAGRITVPAPHVSSCAFGGEDMKTLFITTARDGLSEQELKSAPLSGHIFTARVDIPGVPVTRCRSFP